MPELPEVEIYARYFARHALGQRIIRVRVLDERILGDTRKGVLSRTLTGKVFTEVKRHGKHLFAGLTEGSAGPPATWLHLHFGMSGDLAYYDSDGVPPRFARVIFDFEGGCHLAYDDMRLFGVIELAPSPEAYIEEHRLGPDPLAPGFRLTDFRRLVAKRRGAVKSLLMSQDVIAGVGNLYADETFYQAGIDPRRPVDALDPDEVRKIYTVLRRILKSTIEQKSRGDDYPPRSLVQHREEGERCPLCGGTIKRTVVFGRTTYYCGKHQR